MSGRGAARRRRHLAEGPGVRLLVALVALVAAVAAPAASAFRPSSRWLLDEAASKQLERALRNLKVEQETQLFDAGGAARGGPYAERVFFQSPASMRRESDLPEGARVEVRVDDRVTVKAGGQADKPAKGNIDVVTDFFTLGGAVNPDQATERLLRDMKALGVNPEIVSLARFDGRVAYLIGSKPWETDKPQLWLDKETLLVVRVVSLVRGDGARPVRTDVRLLGYGSSEGGNWFPKAVETWVDDKLVRRSTTRAVDKNVPLEATLFDARR